MKQGKLFNSFHSWGELVEKPTLIWFPRRYLVQATELFPNKQSILWGYFIINNKYKQKYF